MEQNKEKFVSLKDIEGYETNPFMVELKGRMYLQPRANTIIARGQEIIDTATGEVLQDDVLIGRRKIVDKSQFAKIYASEIGVLHDLSKAAILMFMHLSKVMDYENKAIFDYQKQCHLLGYKSHKQPLMAIRELITRNIIAPHYIANIYWMNPAIVCKGERFAKYTEYVTEERHKKDIEQARLRKQSIDKKSLLQQSEISDKIDAMEWRERENVFTNSPDIPFDE